MSDIATISSGDDFLTKPIPVSVRDALSAFIGRLAPATRQGYNKDLRCFARFMGYETIYEVLPVLVAGGRGQANISCLQWQAEMQERQIQPATINRRLMGLRAALAALRLAQIIDWDLDIKGVKAEQYKDTRGPGEDGAMRIIGAAQAIKDPVQRARNVAILTLMWDLGLRRGEIERLNVADLNLVSGDLYVIGKGKREAKRMTLPESSVAALGVWLAKRPSTNNSDPLFVSLDHANHGARLTGRSLHRIVATLGKQAGIEEGRARPHGIRHASITQLGVLTNGNVLEMQAFSRHADVKTLLKYVDNMRDKGGEMSRKVSESLRQRQAQEKGLTGEADAGRLGEPSVEAEGEHEDGT